MPDLRFPNIEDFHDWCKEHMSDIIERFPQIDESVEFEDIEIDNVYILRYSQKYSPPEKFHIIYIIETYKSGKNKEFGYHYMSFYYKGGKWRRTDLPPRPGVGLRWLTARWRSNKHPYDAYHIIPVSSNDFSFINWSDDPFTVK